MSQSTILRVMKKKLRLSYKKLSKTNPKNFDYENITRILKSASLLTRLCNTFTEVLYIDEFSFNARKVNYYGWSPVNSKWYISKIPESFTISFIVGLSVQRYYGIIGKVGAIDSIIVSKYLKWCIDQF